MILILKELIKIKSINERIRLVDYQPTCENMLIEIIEILKKKRTKGNHYCKRIFKRNSQ